MKQIVFTEENKAIIREIEKRVPGQNEVCVKMAFTAISAGTERANLVGGPTVAGGQPYPRQLGYSGSGYVESVGEGVDDLKPGDRVITWWGKHMQYNTLPRSQVMKIESDTVRMEDAAFTLISTFSLAAVRKIKPEIAESGLVVGLGLLGIFSVQFMRIAGVYPVIAADINAKRRTLALKLGADYALDPMDSEYENKVKELCGGNGPDCAIEVTGNGNALNQTLKCMKPFGRVALLGCTRIPTTVDFYHDVHFKGLTLVGAHTIARPKQESRPGFWTETDDCRAALQMLAGSRLNVRDMIHEIHFPLEAESVYNRLAVDPDFPIGVLFDWTELNS